MPVGLEVHLGPSLTILHPLSVSREPERSLLEALLSDHVVTLL